MAPTGASMAASRRSLSTGMPRAAATRATSPAVRSSSAASATRGAVWGRARIMSQQPVGSQARDQLGGVVDDGGVARDPHRLRAPQAPVAVAQLGRADAERGQIHDLDLGRLSAG